MIFIDEMKNLKIYRKQFFLPYNDKDKKHGSAVYLLTPNYISSKGLMTSPLTINRRYFESYYFERNVAYYINSGSISKDELIAEAVQEQIDSAVHNGFDYEAFDEYMLIAKGTEVDSTNNTYYPSVMAAVVANKLNNGSYDVYIHPVNHPEDPTYIGTIAVQVIQHSFYDAFYKWTNWEVIEDEGEYIEEAKREDALYNKDKFESGEINLCFITGLSGSGKSTMARGLNAEHYELDDLLVQYNFSDENLKEYGDLISSFFKGPGKKYRTVTSEDGQTDKYEEGIVRDFIKYAKSYAASHKNNKFIIEGVELIWFINPSELKDYAVFVKGTSVNTSMHRSAWRDSSDAKNRVEKITAYTKNMLNKDRREAYHQRDKDVQKWIDYFSSKSVNEATLDSFSNCNSIISDIEDELDKLNIPYDNPAPLDTSSVPYIPLSNNVMHIGEATDKEIDEDFILESQDKSIIDDDHKTKSISGIKYIDGTSSEAWKYYKRYEDGDHLYTNMKDYWLKDKGSKALLAIDAKYDMIAGYVCIKANGSIQPIFIYPPYRGYGISTELMKRAIKDYGATKLGVYSDNQIAVHLYKSMGFKEYKRKKYKDGSEAIMMKLDEATDRLDNDYTSNIDIRYNIVSRDGADNACVKVEGYDKPMRGRSSMLTIKQVGNECYIFCTTNKDGSIKAPGGGWNINETPRDAAIRELQEEAFIKVKDVMHCGCLIEYDENEVAEWVKDHVDEKDWWYGYYSEIFVGKYDGEFEGQVEDRDKDDIAEKGKWMSLEEFSKLKPKEYVNAINKYIELNKFSSIQEATIIGDGFDKYKDRLNKDIDNLCRKFKTSPPTIYITIEKDHATLMRNGAKHGIEDWSRGYSYDDKVVVEAEDQYDGKAGDYYDLIFHECIHVILHKMNPNYHDEEIIEGICTYESGQYDKYISNNVHYLEYAKKVEKILETEGYDGLIGRIKGTIKESSLQEAFEYENAVLLEQLEDVLLEISKADHDKNDKLEPIFVVNTYTGSKFGKLIQKITNADYSHSLLSFDPSLNKMYSYDFGKTIKYDKDAEIEADGFVIDNLDRYKRMETNNIKVIVMFVPRAVKKAMEEIVEWYHKNITKTKYGFSNLLDYLRGSKKLSSFKDFKLFCSEFVDSILKSQNIDITGKTSRNAAPSDLGKYTEKNNFFNMFEGRAIDYDEQEIEYMLDAMKSTVPYKNLNAIKPKLAIAEADETLNLADKLKYMVRALKMKNKRGIYKFNKERRKADSGLPTADQIQNSVTVPTPSISGGGSASANEMYEYKHLLQYEKEDSYIVTEDSLVLLGESDGRYDSPLRKMLWNDRIRSNKEVLNLYKLVKNDLPFIKYTFTNPTRYQNRNLFYDLSYYNEIFFRHNNIYKMDKAVDLYLDFMSRLLNPSRLSYGKKTVFIPILDWVDNPKTRTWLYRDTINPISVIHRIMVRDINKLKSLFGNMDIIFIGKDCYFKINFSNLLPEQEKSCAMTFKNFIVKIERGQTFTPDEEDDTPANQESDKVIVTNIVDKISKAKNINMDTKSAYINTSIAKAFTGDGPYIAASPTRPNKISFNMKSPTKADIKKELDKDKKDSKEILNKTTKDNSISKEGKIQKQADIQSIEKDKEDLINQITAVATSALNTDDAIEKMNDNEYITNIILKLAAEEDAGLKINQARINRMAQLNSEFLNKEVKGVTVKDILASADDDSKINAPLPSTSIETESAFADQWKDLKYINFNSNYDINEDILKILNALSKKQYPISIRNIDISDSSTSEDYIDTYSIDMEDFRGKRFNVKLDIPKFKNNKYLILRGNKWVIQNQYFNMPILKTEQDTVQIISNYNKIFVRRFGNTKGKSICYSDRLIKALSKYTGNSIKVVYGDNSKLGDYYDMPIDYLDLGSMLHTITFKHNNNKATIYFSQKEIREKYKSIIDDTLGLPFGYIEMASNSPAYTRIGDVLVKDNILYFSQENYKFGVPFSLSLVSLLCENPEFKEIYDNISSAKRYVYSQASILNQKIPVVILCGYTIGLLPTLQKANIEYTLMEKITRDIRKNPQKDFIEFSDGYLVYDVSYDSSLLLNGLKDIDTKQYSIDQINSKRIYIEMLDNYGGRIIADGLENFAECMIDPITEEVLKHYKLPGEYVDLLITANALLSDNSYIGHGDASSRRLRKNELIAVKVYKALFNDAYSKFATSMRRNANNVVFFVKKSAVIDKFIDDPTASGLSVTNCLHEVEDMNAISTKGESGMNSDRSYTLNKRIYDSSMINLMGMSTGQAGTVGVTRQATINMNIDGKRGYVKSIDGDTSKMNAANTLTISEALNPIGCTHDDPVRVAMTFTQTSKHQIRTEKSDPLLITNGSDEVLPYLVSDIFCKKSEQAGTVKEITDKYMVVEYANKSNDYIDLSNRIEKNSDGGFYLGVKLDTDMKVGQKFKANEILAYDKSSFSKGKLGNMKNITYDVGTLTKIAVINSDDNFEDSAMITTKLANDLATEIILLEDKILSADTNIYNWKKVGESVNQEDILYETQTAYEDEDINILLKNLAGDTEMISKLGRKPVKSPVTGTIVGIKVYRTCELEDLSDSLKKFVSSVEAESNKTLSKLKSLGISDPTVAGSNKKLEPIGKLKNRPDSVLIEYYVQYHDIVSIGDKITYWSANKGVIRNIIPSELAPYTDFRPDEEVSAYTGISSINKRQISSNLIVGSLNKLCIELGRSVREILGIPYMKDEV